MKKSALKSLSINKRTIATFDVSKINGGVIAMASAVTSCSEYDTCGDCDPLKTGNKD